MSLNTVEPWYNEVPAITNDDTVQPAQSYIKMYGTEHQYKVPRYNKIPKIMNTIHKPKLKKFTLSWYNE